MPPTRPRRPRRKRADQYHHGDLRNALMQAALRTIQRHGVDGLTLRGVGEDLGVSRTALYRHFTDKSALLAAVCTEGFRALRGALTEAWEGQGRGMAGFEAMGLAYIRFARENPSYYRVMFGAAVARPSPDPELAKEGAGAFQVLVDALVELQQAGLVRRDPPMLQAEFVWAIVHGVAMLGIDGRLPPAPATGPGDPPDALDLLARFAIQRLESGIAVNA